MSVDNEMRRVGRIVAADQGLEVSVRGVRAFAVPGRVTIPNVERFEWLGRRHARRMLHGLLDHECGHALYTDFDALKGWREREKPCEALNTLQNVVEDGYVERMQGARYRGCATNIRLMNEWFHAEKGADGATFEDRLRDPGADVIGVVISAIGAVLTPYGHLDIDHFERVNPVVGSMLRAVESELEEAQAVTGAKRTRSNIDLAERIFAKLAARAKGSGGSASGKAPAASPEDAESELERWTNRTGIPFSASDQVNVTIRRVFEMPDEVQPYIVFSHDFDVELDFSEEDQSANSLPFKRAQQRVREVSDALILAFEAALRSTAFVQPVSGADEGELDPELLCQYAVGSVTSDQLYIEMDEGENDETAVEIVVDCSGSMHGRKAKVARYTAIAMHSALQRVQISHEMTGFTTVESDTVDRHEWARGRAGAWHRNFREMRAALDEARAQGTDVTRFARAIGHHGEMMVPVHAVFKSWSSDDARSLMNIEGIDQNLDGEAVLWAARRLACRHERRKVMFVLSDGHPAGSRDNAQGARYLTEAVQRVVHAGMEIYGIGICSDAVEKFYPLWWRADDPDDLINIAMTGLIEVLTRNRRERARVAAI